MIWSKWFGANDLEQMTWSKWLGAKIFHDSDLKMKTLSKNESYMYVHEKDFEQMILSKWFGANDLEEMIWSNWFGAKDLEQRYSNVQILTFTYL